MATIFHKNEDRSEVQETIETNSEIEDYQTRLKLLGEVAEQANSVTEVSELLEEILRVMQRILRASASSLLLINEDKGEFYLQAARGEKLNTLKQIQLGPDSGIIGWVACNGIPVIANDACRDKRFKKDIDEVTGLVTKSIIAAPIARGQNIIGALELINKVDGSGFNDQDLAVLMGFVSTEALVLLVSMAATAINNIELCQAIKEEYTVDTLAAAAEAKDPYARGHSRHVKEYALLMADLLPLSSKELRVIEFGAMLHDIGKIGIMDNILRKAGPLTCEEWYIMRKHSFRGAKIVSEIPYLEKARNIILYHHERYDGTGYPEGLKGEEIPIGARLVAVADALDTMTTDHSYCVAMTLYEAMTELIRGVGTQFCPVAVEALVSGFEKHKGKLFIEKAEQAANEKAKREAEEAMKAKDSEKLVKKEMEKIKVFLSNPQVLFREGIHFTLLEEEDFEVIGESTNNEDAFAFIEANPPNIAILSLGNGKLDDPEVTRRIKWDLPSVSVILVTDSENEEQLFSALKAGASACLTKDALPEYLLSVMRYITQGNQPIIEALLIPGIASKVLAELQDLSTLSEQISNLLARFSHRETEVLDLIAHGNAIEQIAKKLSRSKDAIRYELRLIVHKLVANNQARAMIEAAKLSLPSMINSTAWTRNSVEEITREEFNEFNESLMLRLKSFIGELV